METDYLMAAAFRGCIFGEEGKLTLTYSKHALKEGTDYETPFYAESSLKKNKIKVTITGKGFQ